MKGGNQTIGLDELKSINLISILPVKNSGYGLKQHQINQSINFFHL